MTTAIVRRVPTQDLYRTAFDRMFSDMLNGFLGPWEGSEEVAAQRFSPAVDVRETREALTLNVELPGLAKEDVHVTLENRVLTVSGERKFEKATQEETYHRIERSYGAFTRSFTLPSNLEVERVDAKFENGVLRLVLPKHEAAKPRKIEIG